MDQLNELINTEKLEELLISKWSHFINTSKLFEFIEKNAKKHQNSFGIINDTTIKLKGKQLMLSCFQLTTQGFIVWVEFTVPIDIGVASGTTELLITTKGIVSHIQTIGNIYLPNNFK
jgi:hypothetical protein